LSIARSLSVTVDDRVIVYREAGQGPPLVLLHGFLCDSRCWDSQLADLSADFRTIAWDAPGGGVSADPPMTFRTADYAKCLATFLNAVGVAQAHIVGLSWGGILAQEFYRLYPSRVRSLVLAGTYAGWRGSLPDEAWRQRLEDCLRSADAPPEPLIRTFVPGAFSEHASPALLQQFSDIVRDYHPTGFRLMALSSAEVDTRALLPRIDVPTLLVWGDSDRRSPLDVAEQFRAAIPNAHLLVIPNAGHVCNMERPDVFNLHVRAFCLSV
jgi:pimeloyl-ACP methyl ester carboxylesterase